MRPPQCCLTSYVALAKEEGRGAALPSPPGDELFPSPLVGPPEGAAGSCTLQSATWYAAGRHAETPRHTPLSARCSAPLFQVAAPHSLVPGSGKAVRPGDLSPPPDGRYWHFLEPSLNSSLQLCDLGRLGNLSASSQAGRAGTKRGRPCLAPPWVTRTPPAVGVALPVMSQTRLQVTQGRAVSHAVCTLLGTRDPDEATGSGCGGSGVPSALPSAGITWRGLKTPRNCDLIGVDCGIGTVCACVTGGNILTSR